MKDEMKAEKDVMKGDMKGKRLEMKDKMKARKGPARANPTAPAPPTAP